MTIDAPQVAQVAQLRALWQEAFGDTDAFLDAFYHTAFCPERSRCVMVEGNVVAAVYWFSCSCDGRKVAYIYALATAKAYQGHGYGRKLMSAVRELLAEQGFEAVLLVPGEESLRRYYEAMGYRTCTYIREFECTAGADILQMYAIDGEEFCRLRRQMLPDGAVLQEEAGLDFLAQQVKFYAGNGFLLAARKEGRALFAPELLGDPALAPAILQTLGCSEGTFRSPGGRDAFAMGLLLQEGAKLPTYFAFAFD